MIRRPRQTKPHFDVSEIGQMLAPLPVFAWGELAMSYLGIPVAVDVEMIAVCNEHWRDACQRLEQIGFRTTSYTRRIDFELASQYHTRNQALNAIMEDGTDVTGYGALLEFPDWYNSPDWIALAVFPNYFVHLPLVDQFAVSAPNIPPEAAEKYDIYGNVCYPSTLAFLESLIDGIREEVDPYDESTYSRWAHRLKNWLGFAMVSLDVDPDLPLEFPDARGRKWYRYTFGSKSGFKEKWKKRHLRIEEARTVVTEGSSLEQPVTDSNQHEESHKQ